MDSTSHPNLRIDADRFTDLQVNSGAIMEDFGIMEGNRIMMLHLPAVAENEVGHANLDADFSHLDGDPVNDWVFLMCGRCNELAEKAMFFQMTGELPNDKKGEVEK